MMIFFCNGITFCASSVVQKNILDRVRDSKYIGFIIGKCTSLLVTICMALYVVVVVVFFIFIFFVIVKEGLLYVYL